MNFINTDFCSSKEYKKANQSGRVEKLIDIYIQQIYKELLQICKRKKQPNRKMGKRWTSTLQKNNIQIVSKHARHSISLVISEMQPNRYQGYRAISINWQNHWEKLLTEIPIAEHIHTQQTQS